MRKLILLFVLCILMGNIYGLPIARGDNQPDNNDLRNAEFSIDYDEENSMIQGILDYISDLFSYRKVETNSTCIDLDDFKCNLSIHSFDNSVSRMTQYNVKNIYLTETDGSYRQMKDENGNLLYFEDGTPTYISVHDAGCALVSEAMVINYFAGFNAMSIKLINSKLSNTLNYNPDNFVNTFGRDYGFSKMNDSFYAYYDRSLRRWKKTPLTREDAINYIAPKINSDTIAIVGGRARDGRTHYVVVNGYDYVTYTDENGNRIKEYTDLHIKDPGGYNRKFSDSVKDSKGNRIKDFSFEWSDIYDVVFYTRS